MLRPPLLPPDSKILCLNQIQITPSSNNRHQVPKNKPTANSRS